MLEEDKEEEGKDRNGMREKERWVIGLDSQERKQERNGVLGKNERASQMSH